MTIAEVVSSSIALLAFIISAVTAYRTLFTRFRAEVFLKSRVVLTRINQVPCLVVGCEVANLGARSGAIEDMILIVKYRHEKSKIRNDYSFLPLLSREDYSVFKSYQETDFEPFQSIFVPKVSSVTRYIVFSPSSDSFSPLAGQVELRLFTRSSGKSKWRKAAGRASFSIDDDLTDAWQDPEGQSIMTDTIENNTLREKLMEQTFK